MNTMAADQSDISLTKRATSVDLEAILGDRFDVLDHGFVRVVDYMGNDGAIVQAARTSYGQGTKTVSNDEGLIRYLLRHNHSTPFEMCEIKLHVKLPVFVARQWIRHRTANVNEYSARYSILDREFYIPEIEHIAVQSSDNKQGRGETLSQEKAGEVRAMLLEDALGAYDTYKQLIREPDREGYGLARELARINLPTNIYTQWYWKTDLHNLFHFLKLRADPHAQYEIRAYAEVICQLVQIWVPLAFKAFQDYRQNSASFSAKELRMLQIYLKGFQPSLKFLKDQGLSDREAAEFLKKLQLTP